GADLGQQGTARSRRQHAQHAEDDEGNAEHQQPDTAQPALVTHGPHRAAVQPGQHEQHGDGSTHGDNAEELVRYRTEDRIERSEVPNRCDVLRSLERVGLFEVRLLEEVTTHFREEEHHEAEHEEEHHYGYQIMHSVVRMESDAIQRLAVLILQ